MTPRPPDGSPPREAGPRDPELPSATRSRHVLLSLVVLGMVVVVVEGAAWLAARHLVALNVLYEPPVKSRYLGFESYGDYLERRDPVLGWPPPDSFGGDRYDRTGSRPIPAFPEPADACVSLYGDSMTYGAEVDHDHAWGNVLSGRLGCRVANYGVGGYGTDQAFLRFRENRGDEAEVIALGHLSVNILRNVNQFRGLLAGNPYGFKPRFILDGDQGLELVPIPTLDPQDFTDFLRQPDRYLEHEYFGLEAPAVSVQVGFPYLATILRALGHFKVRAALARRPGHAVFYERGHASNGLEVTARIIEHFQALAEERGKVPLTVVIPIGSDFEYHVRTGEWAYQSLLDRLRQAGVEPIDAGRGMMSRLEPGRHPCELFRDCSGHFNEEGYALLAAVVHEAMQARGVTPSPGPTSDGSPTP